MTAAGALRVGAMIVFDGDRYTVTEILDTAVVLRSRRGNHRRVSIVDLLRPLADGGKARLFPAADTDSEDAGVLGGGWADASKQAQQVARDRAAHIREALTGYRSGHPQDAGVGEPRAAYGVGVPRGRRVRAKAEEMGVGVRTLERWIGRYRESGEFGLVDQRNRRRGGFAPGVDPRWMAMARVVIDEQVNEPKIAKRVVIARIKARLDRVHGAGVVSVPSRSTAYQALTVLDRGHHTFTGPTKRKRSVANAPKGAHGELRATRPGEYVLMDTTPLDVFALSPVTGEWVSVDLTFAMDLYSRCVLGMRLTPGSTKSVDVSSVLVEAVYPFEKPEGFGPEARWPYHGLPETIIVDEARATIAGRYSPPSTLPEFLVTDHGSPYVSEHVSSACARLGISLQPARVYRGSDKGQAERFFLTLTSLLQELPGYKGPDVPARGQDPESDAVYTLPQMEQIIREWVATVYHVREHSSLADPGLHGVALSPAEKYTQGLSIVGEIRLPRNRNYVLEFLPVAKRQFNHYGVELNGVRYSGEIVAKYRGRSRGLDGDVLWPFSYDPDDVRRIYFRDPEDGTWHTLRWRQKSAAAVPFSTEALTYAKRLAVELAEGGRPDVDAAAAKLLTDWGAGRELTPTERRVSARLASQLAENHRDAEGTWSLRVVQRMLALDPHDAHDPDQTIPLLVDVPGGDDDDDEELLGGFEFGDDELMEMM